MSIITITTKSETAELVILEKADLPADFRSKYEQAIYDLFDDEEADLLSSTLLEEFWADFAKLYTVTRIDEFYSEDLTLTKK
jgi:hypothetical protein